MNTLLMQNMALLDDQRFTSEQTGMLTDDMAAGPSMLETPPRPTIPIDASTPGLECLEPKRLGMATPPRPSAAEEAQRARVHDEAIRRVQAGVRRWIARNNAQQECALQVLETIIAHPLELGPFREYSERVAYESLPLLDFFIACKQYEQVAHGPRGEVLFQQLRQKYLGDDLALHSFPVAPHEEGYLPGDLRTAIAHLQLSEAQKLWPRRHKHLHAIYKEVESYLSAVMLPRILPGYKNSPERSAYIAKEAQQVELENITEESTGSIIEDPTARYASHSQDDPRAASSPIEVSKSPRPQAPSGAVSDIEEQESLSCLACARRDTGQGSSVSGSPESLGWSRDRTSDEGVTGCVRKKTSQGVPTTPVSQNYAALLSSGGDTPNNKAVAASSQSGACKACSIM